MKSTHLKLSLGLAILIGIANVNSFAANKIAGINIAARIPAISINATQKRIITDRIASNLIVIGQTIQSVNVVKTNILNPPIVAANILPVAAGIRVIESGVAVKDIDIQASLPIVL